MGTPQYAHRILQSLIDAEDMSVSLVVTQPDRPVGRKRVMSPPPVKVLAQNSGIEVLQPERLIDDDIKEKISSIKPDFIIVAAFGQILPKEILEIAPCINLHASLLPQYRGASPLQQSLLNGDRYSGVTSMLMEEGLDSGPTLGYICYETPQDMRLQELTDRLSELASILTLDTVRSFDQIEPLPQTGAEATYCKKIKKADGQITFDDAQKLYNKYCAFDGWPGIFTDNGLKITKMRLSDIKSEQLSGQILSIGDESITVGCKRGAVEIIELQPPSKKSMYAKSYLLGKGLRVGDILV
jgi:methionyl-tRNA formyltransferase